MWVWSSGGILLKSVPIQSRSRPSRGRHVQSACLSVRLLPSLHVSKNSRISNRIVLRFYNKVFNYFNSENIDLHITCRFTCVSAATSSKSKGKALPVQNWMGAEGFTKSRLPGFSDHQHNKVARSSALSTVRLYSPEKISVFISVRG
jgi:hypothetical protein